MGLHIAGDERGFYGGVVVYNVTPSYYAVGNNNGEYVLTGRGFNLIPNDALGINAWSNNDPTYLVNTTNDANITPIVSKTDDTITFRQPTPHGHDVRTYLGCIVSADRQTIYWVNISRPLP